jgi:hypothetical protein
MEIHRKRAASLSADTPVFIPIYSYYMLLHTSANLQTVTADQSKHAEPTAAHMVVHGPSESTVDCGSSSFFRINSSPNLHFADGNNESIHECKLQRFYLRNATSLAKKSAKEQLLVDIQMVRIDLVMIVKTCFISKYLGSDVNPDGFILFRRDRIRRQGGGLCIYVHNSIPCSVYQPDIVCYHSNVEVIWLKLNCCAEVFFIALCYYPPNPIPTADMFVS